MNRSTPSGPADRHEPTALPRPDDRFDREALGRLTREDVRAHNAKVAHLLKTQGAVRPQVAFFRCPWPVTPRQYERIRKAAVDKWVGYMEQTGWQLVSPVVDYPHKRRTATATSGDWYGVPVLDRVEVPVAAYFKKLDMKLERAEVPVSTAAE